MKEGGTMLHSFAALVLGLCFLWSCGAAPTPSTPPVDDTTTVASKTATAPKQLGEACEEDAQCRLLDQHALCTNGSCLCDSGFYHLHEHNGTLCRLGGAGSSTEPVRTAGTHLDINMIAVICALAVMFLGICVALHLFSRARFRNRRTIFNSPHPRLMHIKLGKKKKKKLSGSQHLTTPIHHPVVPRHHSFSVNHVSSPLPLSRVPKTRSHECLRSAGRRDSSPKLEMRYTPRAPLAEKESSSVPSTEDLEKKTPDPVLPNGVAMVSGEHGRPPSSPTVIITDADGSHHQVVSSSRSSLTNGSAVNV